jgi:hypothetical protein
VGPRRIGLGHAVVEDLLDRGEDADAHRPEIRQAMVEALEGLHRLTATIHPDPALPRALVTDVEPGTPWPRPHHPMFDFAATRRGAEWIDEVAWRARAVLESGAGHPVMGHSDWSVKDFRFEGDRITAIYDWQSLCIEREPVLVGLAAKTFTMTWRLPVPWAPTLQETQAFVREYGRARGSPFTEAERATVGAAAALGLAYTARCEHARAPQGVTPPDDSARAALRDHGEQLLGW